MIRKHAFTLVWILVAAMIAAALWRISLLPDWSRLTMARADGAASHAASSLWLFSIPAGLAFAVMAKLASRRMVAGKPEAVQSVQAYGDRLMLGMAVIAALLHGIILGRSLGVALPYDAIARCLFVGMGVLMVLLGNRLPKLPWVTSTTIILDDAGIQKMRRINAFWMVLQGVIFVLAGLLLHPLRNIVWLVLPLTLGGVVGIIGYALWLRQRQTGVVR